MLLTSGKSSEILQPLEKSLEYQRRAEKYLDNAKKLVLKQEFIKASELLWGNVVELVKAVGVLYGFDASRLKHKATVNTGKKIALELGDVDMAKLIGKAQALHINFYEDFMDREEFAEHYDAVIRLTKKFYDILNQKRMEFSIHI